jgi:aryl-alcohol dehydrogenase-like predicted oxidoreductase
MEFKNLGKTGLRVSELCLGAMTLGREATEAESFQMLDLFVGAGGNFIDIANVYAGGVSEEVVGKWLARQRRDQFVIATKVRFKMGSGPNDIGLSRKHIMAAVRESLRRMGTDYIDLYQVHAWDPATPLEETLGALNDLVRDGLVRYVGASNFRGWQLQKAIDLSLQHGWERFCCLQPQYNLLTRATEYELVAVCLAEGLGIIPWSPLRGGWLSGRYQRGMKPPAENTRVGMAEKMGWGENWTRYNTEFTWHVIDELTAISKAVGKSVAQTALRWLMQKPAVTAPIVGARSLDQLKDNLGAAGWSLSPELMLRLDKASTAEVSYPYDEAAEKQQRDGRA